MEKIKSDYKKVSLELLSVFTIFFIFATLVGFIPFKALFQIPIWVFFIVLFDYTLDRLKWFGYFISNEGISRWTSGGYQTERWNDVTIGKDFLGEKIILSKIKKSFYINTISSKSLFILIKRNCPIDHELYKHIETFTKEKNIPF